MHTQPTDMRQHFNGLPALVTQAMGHDVLPGDYFVFLYRFTDCELILVDSGDSGYVSRHHGG